MSCCMLGFVEDAEEGLSVFGGDSMRRLYGLELEGGSSLGTRTGGRVFSSCVDVAV